jgi:Flp pilus assembly protein TadD
MSQGSGNGGDSRPGGDSQQGGREPGGGHEPQPPDGDVYALYRRGMDLLHLGSAAAAAQVLEHAAGAEPDSRSIREALARAQFDSGHYTAAAENFRQIVDHSPADDYAQFGLGLSLARAGRPAAAARHLALAAAMCPDSRHYARALRGVRATLRAREAR